MFDSFPFDEWSEDIADFWAWGGANSTGTYIMTVLGIILMVAALYGFVILEQGKLERQAEALRGAAGLGPTPPANPTGSV
ncbi:MAG: hypothetical protein H0V45_02285 [Actinobacteria bacterium]|nr:hypothetical protein [Actinomycetota bacterium]